MKMASVDISGYLQDILTAVYGEEVRGSIHDAIAALHAVVEEDVTILTSTFDWTTPAGTAADAKAIHEQAVLIRGKLTSGSPSVPVDLNEINTSGVYRLVSSETYTNSPLTSSTGWLVVYQYGDGGRNCMQLVYETGTAGTSRVLNSFFRNYSAGGEGWTDWQAGNYSLDDSLTIAGSAADAKAVGDRFAELEYSPIEITDLNYNVTTEDGIISSNNPSDPENAAGARVENGTVVINMNYQWVTNKIPAKVTLDGNSLPVSGNMGTGTLTPLHITSNKTWTFKAKESPTASILPVTTSKGASVIFLPRVFWGTALDHADPDSTFIESFRSTGSALADDLERVFTVTAGAGEYIWYAYPTYFGIPEFSYGGFKGGFKYIKQVTFTNMYNVTEQYYIYRSVQPTLGNVEITVTKAS